MTRQTRNVSTVALLDILGLVTTNVTAANLNTADITTVNIADYQYQVLVSRLYTIRNKTNILFIIKIKVHCKCTSPLVLVLHLAEYYYNMSKYYYNMSKLIIHLYPLHGSPGVF